MTAPLRKPRTKPPYKLPPRSEYDGRPYERISDCHWRQHPFRFDKFAAANIGWQYMDKKQLEAWRYAFSAHLQGYLQETRNLREPVECVELCRPMQFQGIRVIQKPGIGPKCLELPFGLLLLIVDPETQVTTGAGAWEYVRGYLYDAGELRKFIIFTPPK